MADETGQRKNDQLGARERAALAEIGERRTFGDGEALCREGDDGDCLFLIERGAAHVVRYAANGRDAILAFLGPGDVTGEMACLAELPRTATVEAAGPLEALVVHRADLLQRFREEPDLAVSFIRLLSARLAEADALVMSLSALKMRGRLAAGLLQLLARHGRQSKDGVRLALDITQRELGAFVGLSRENVSRVLAEWRNANIVTQTTGGEILVRDRARLEDLAIDD